MKFTICLKELQINCSIGVTEQEREKKQLLEVDIELQKDLSMACKLDQIEKTINYDEVATCCIQQTSKEYHLIEALAYAMFQVIWDTFSPTHLMIKVKKKARADISFAAIILEKERA